MKKKTGESDLGIPELKRGELGIGVRGKYYRRFLRGSRIVVMNSKTNKPNTKSK
ncbi:hypothetical protein LLG95_00130 [bacterium]|nr:hypothetical protein [bacterium]